MSSQLLALVVLDGIAYGALVFLVAVGLTLVFGVMRILNVAHGSFYALGAYAAASLGLVLSGMGLPAWLSLPLFVVAAVIIGTVVGGAMERYLLARIYEREEALQLLVTFAVFMILENLQRLIWGVQPYFYAEPIMMMGNVPVAGITYTAYQMLFLPLVAIAVLIGLRLFLRRTLAGALIVAVTEDREAATTIGINAERIFFVTFAIGASLAVLGGALAAPTTSVIPGMGADMIVLSFAVAATAGLGSIEGAALTALLIGLGRSFAVFFAPEFEVVMPYLIMALVLLVRPQGLFGHVTARKI
ncbi:branched-chain amino acid ABC transporter permease [Acuticoccus kandeliae]|uniref:branched-chain amino acid ABC transporter permease n=1 Tax=Acuticoccus kandeliae TaxID=2073160 RepID=UPI000D3EC8FF|nr:branched-chain amino acid ABC transporter permease [Acuticoccus kandeliae]